MTRRSCLYIQYTATSLESQNFVARVPQPNQRKTAPTVAAGVVVSPSLRGRLAQAGGVGDRPADHNLGRAPLDLTSPFIPHTSADRIAVRSFG